MRRTKIVATIGPATRTPEKLRELITAGVNVVRLNFAHGEQPEHAAVIKHVRKISAELDTPVAVLQDLAGPKIRVGTIPGGSVELQPGQSFTLTSRAVEGDRTQVPVTYPDLAKDVEAGDTILLNDGAIELVVVETGETDARCEVVVGGSLSSHKGINVPSRSISAPILTDKDMDDLRFGLQHGADLVAVSFVRNARDVLQVKKAMSKFKRDAPVIAKIEKHEALDNLDEILAVVEGLMIARGDLGVEIPIESVPRAQKQLTRAANRAGKPVITATQMLRSMVASPRPTRAEVTDVANAVLDGSDAVMLSEETAVGSYPREAVEMMDRTIRSTEESFPFREWANRYNDMQSLTDQQAVAHAACQLAEDTGARAIVTCTQSGSTTVEVARYRPGELVLALTPDEAVWRRLALVWGAVPLRMAQMETMDQMEKAARECVKKSGRVKEGEKIVITAGVPLHQTRTTNTVKLTAV